MLHCTNMTEKRSWNKFYLENVSYKIICSSLKNEAAKNNYKWRKWDVFVTSNKNEKIFVVEGAGYRSLVVFLLLFRYATVETTDETHICLLNLIKLIVPNHKKWNSVIIYVACIVIRNFFYRFFTRKQHFLWMVKKL